MERHLDPLLQNLYPKPSLDPLPKPLEQKAIRQDRLKLEQPDQEHLEGDRLFRLWHLVLGEADLPEEEHLHHLEQRPLLPEDHRLPEEKHLPHPGEVVEEEVQGRVPPKAVIQFQTTPYHLTGILPNKSYQPSCNNLNLLGEHLQVLGGDMRDIGTRGDKNLIVNGYQAATEVEEVDLAISKYRDDLQIRIRVHQQEHVLK